MAERKFRILVAGAGVWGLFTGVVDVLSRQCECPFQPNDNWSRQYAPAASS